jgi:hypothetical protein
MDGMIISAERDQLDHQRDRIQKILKDDMVSPSMRFDLERLLTDISQRLWELEGFVPGERQPLMVH